MSSINELTRSIIKSTYEKARHEEKDCWSKQKELQDVLDRNTSGKYSFHWSGLTSFFGFLMEVQILKEPHFKYNRVKVLG